MGDYEVGVGTGIREMDHEIEKTVKEEKDSFVRTLEEISETFNFFSWGFSPPLKITRGDKTEYIKVKIKSVGVAEIIEEYQEKAPVPPATLKTYKRDSDVVRQLGQKRDVTVWEINEADPEYQSRSRKHNNEAAQMILLHGLAYDLKTPDGHIVLKGAKTDAPSEILNAEKALMILRGMGLSSQHFATLVQSIRELTEERDQAETLD